MRKITTKYRQLLLAAAVCFLLLLCVNNPVMAANGSGSCGANATWNLQSGVLTITGSGDMEDYTESSPAPWYKYKEDITRVVIEEGITKIGVLAFYDCTVMESASIANSVTIVDDYAFFNCKLLSNVNLGNGVKIIGKSAFERCGSLSVIKLPDSLTHLKERAFYRCSSLSSITVPSYASNMGTSVFAYCENLVQAVIKPYLTKLPAWTFYGCSSLVSVSLPSSITEIGEYAFYDCGNLETAYSDTTTDKKTPLEETIKETVPDFGTVEDKPSTDSGYTETWRADSESTESDSVTEEKVVQKDVIETDGAVVNGVISQKPSVDEDTDKEYSMSIEAVIKDETGWDAVVDMVDKYVQQQPSLEKETWKTTTVKVTVNVGAAQSVPGSVLESLAGKNVNLLLKTEGINYSIECSTISTDKKIGDYTLTFEVVKNTSPTTEHKKLIGNAESYFLKINGKAEFAVSLLIPLDVKYARSTATLYEKPALQNWSSVQSALIDESGYVELYLSDFDSVTEYLIAIDVYNTDSSTVIIPESLYDEYGGLTDSEGNKYVISGTNTLFNMSFWQFGLVVLGVIVGTGVLVGVVMMIINKRKKTLEEIRKEVSREEQ